MKNSYLKLDIDDVKISSIIKEHIKKLNSSIEKDEFKKIIIELSNIDDGTLCEYDENLISSLYNSMHKKYEKNIIFFIDDNTKLNNGQTFGQLMKFLYSLEL